MAINRKALAELAEHLDAEDITRLTASAQRIDRIEQEHVRRFESFFASLELEAVNALERDELPSIDADQIFSMLLEHWRDTTEAAIQSTGGGVEVVGDTVVKLARKKIKSGAPTNMRELRELYDYFRTNARAAKRYRQQAEQIKRLYLKRIQELVKERSREFNAGAAVKRDELALEVKKKIATAWARTKTTLETESTRNYNNTRRGIYDLSPDVTHYLFVAIRDFATTKWCRSRDKLVYKKGDPLLDKETPPIHWNCRSELLPLTPQNPVHLKLIKNKTMARRSHRCEPMPPGWVSSKAA